MTRIEHIGDAGRTTAIYALCDPDNSPRYVGKTVQYLHERHKAHIRAARKPKLPVHYWIAKRIKRNEPLVIRLIEYINSDHDWAARERHWITEYKRQGYDLLNLTEGGEGLAGHRLSQSHRDKIAARLRTGKTFRCEECGSEFWRKRSAIAKGNCRFCSRTCYSSSLKGVNRPVSELCKERGVIAAAEQRSNQSHCKRGHLLSGDNLYAAPNGSRVCRECRKIHKAEYKARCNG